MKKKVSLNKEQKIESKKKLQNSLSNKDLTNNLYKIDKKVLNEEKYEDNQKRTNCSINILNKQTKITPEKEDNKISNNKIKFQYNGNKQKQITLDFFGVKIPVINKEENFPLLENNEVPIQLKIFTWNINGIRAVIKKSSLQKFIEEQKPDILCLNETKIDEISLNSEKIQELFKKDYLTYWNFSKIKKGYSGVAIFTKFRPIKISYDIGVSEHDQEGRVMYIEFQKIIIISVYVPNSGLGKFEYRTQKWDKAFKEYINKIKEENKEKVVIITGDLNVCKEKIDLFDYEERGEESPFSKEEREGLENIMKIGFIDAFRYKKGDVVEYSWFANDFAKNQNHGMRIDYFLVGDNGKENINDCKILKKYNGSDHVPVELIYNYN